MEESIEHYIKELLEDQRKKTIAEIQAAEANRAAADAAMRAAQSNLRREKHADNVFEIAQGQQPLLAELLEKADKLLVHIESSQDIPINHLAHKVDLLTTFVTSLLSYYPASAAINEAQIEYRKDTNYIGDMLKLMLELLRFVLQFIPMSGVDTKTKVHAEELLKGIDILNDPIEGVQRLIRVYDSSLQYTEEQIAKQGITPTLDLLHTRDDIESKLEELEIRRANLILQREQDASHSAGS